MSQKKTRTKPVFQEPTIQQSLRVVAQHGSSNIPELLLAAADRIDELEKCIGQMHDIIEIKEGELPNYWKFLEQKGISYDYSN